MLQGNPNNVSFDYEGALALARKLWALADQVTATTRNRQHHAQQAEKDFIGSYRNQFDQRMTNEAAAARRVSQALQAEAGELARLWKNMMDEQNRRLHGQQTERLHEQYTAERGTAAKVGDWLTGDDFVSPPAPDAVPLPQPPDYLPTAGALSYQS